MQSLDDCEPFVYTDTDLSAVLPGLLARAALTGGQLAYILDVSLQQVRFWLQPGMHVSKKYFGDLAFVFGISIEQLLTRAQRLQRFEPPPDHAAKNAMQQLLGAGMVRLHDVRPASFEFSCLMCGRGLGPNGTLWRTRHVPKRMPSCQWCGGSLLADECLSGGLERELYRQEHSRGIAA